MATTKKISSGNDVASLGPPNNTKNILLFSLLCLFDQFLFWLQIVFKTANWSNILNTNLICEFQKRMYFY